MADPCPRSHDESQESTVESTFDRVATDLTHTAFPELADALTQCTQRILDQWRELSIKAMPYLDELTTIEFENTIAEILSAAAAALRSRDPQALRGVIVSAPGHGIDRFLQNYTLLDLFEEVRILRGVIIVQIGEAMARPLHVGEAASFHAIFDIVIQLGVMQLVQEKADHERATEATLRDMNEALMVSNVRQLELTDQARRAEEEASESERRYRAFVTASADVMYRMSPDWNEMLELDGRDFLVGTDHPDGNWLTGYIYREDQPTVMAAIQDAIAIKGLFAMEHRVRRADGSIGWVSSRAVPLVNDRDEIIEWFGVASDITERKSAEELLRRNHDTFFNLIETSPFGMYIVDANFCLLEVSRASRKVFANVNPLVGRDFAEVVRTVWTEPFASEVIARFRHTLTTGEAYDSPNTTEQREDVDELVSYDWKIERITLPDGQLGVACYFYDVSERVEAEQKLHESEVRYRRLFQSAQDGILILDAKSRKIIDANAFMSSLLGLDLSELVGKELFDIGIFENEETSNAAFTELQQSGYIRYDHLLLHKTNGQTAPIEFLGSIYMEGDRSLAQYSARDITARAVMEKLIVEQTESLADQARRKDEFLAMLSHELRNPLAPIRSAVQMLKLQERGTDNPNQQQAREIIERQVGNLTKLTSDLMEVSRVLSGRIRLDLEQADLRQIVEQALQTVAPLLENGQHTVSVNLCSEPVWASVDPTRLEEILVNLLDNASKYTPNGGAIEVSCKLSQGHALVRVRDNGVGIDEELLPHIFDLFTQADRSLDRAAGGLGIGLCLAQQLVRLHGGTIEAHSPPEGETVGSEFVIQLPLVDAVVLPPVLPPLEGALPAIGLHVLVVDDNRDLVKVLTMILEAKGYDVQCAHDGPEALVKAHQWRPDIVLLDIGLPGISGYEVARRLRADSGEKMKLLALTGYGFDTDIALAYEAGFDGHLTKPFDFDVLEKMMSSKAGSSA